MIIIERLIIPKREDLYIGKLLDPKNDYVFKRIFGHIGNEEITKGLISAILDNIEITNIQLDLKKELEPDLRNDKFGILDIRAEINNSVQCDIEMQMADKKDIENRILFYWSRLYAKSLNLGERYMRAKRTIIILFTDYEIDGLEEIKKYLSKWHIREDEYKSIVLTKNLEFCIIELPKYERYISENKELSKWVKFIKNPEEINMEDMNSNEALRRAKEELNKISDDEREEELAFQRLIYKMDQDACQAIGYDRGLKQGIEEGRQEGRQEGEKNKSIEIARKLLKQNISMDIIMDCTGLTKEDIKKL